MNIRCRGPQGSATLSGLDPSCTVMEFQQLVEEKTGVPVALQEFLSGGFPPTALQLPEDPASTPLSALPIQNGDSITVRAGAAAAAADAQPEPPSPGQSEGGAPLTHSFASAAAGAAAFESSVPGGMSEDEALAQAIAASLAEAGAPPAAPGPPAMPPPAPPTSSGPKAAPSSITLPSGSTVVRRIIDSDNSCLFNAVGYVMERTRTKSAELRKVIVDAVKADPIQYNDGVLGKESEEYCRWITLPNTWGGAIELSILSTHFQREIAAYDIQTRRCDIYGEGNGFEERVMVIYDGLHYDALAMGAFEDAPEEIDMTIFNRSSPQAQEASDGADILVQRCHEARQFTDTGNFTLRCGTCQIGVRGEKEATEHAKATGHTNFSEYH